MTTTDITLIDVTNELRRLANGAVRQAKRDSELALVSNVTAIRSLSEMLLHALSQEIVVTSEVVEAPKNPVGFTGIGAIRKEHQN